MKMARLLSLLVLLAVLATMVACGGDPADESLPLTDETGAAGDEVSEATVEAAVEARGSDGAAPDGGEAGEPASGTSGGAVGEQVEALEPASDSEVAPDEITSDPMAWVGQLVRVAGTVDGVVSDRAFTLSSPTSEPLLVVVGSEGSTGDLAPGTAVTATGAVVAAFFVEDIEKETGLDLDDDRFTDFEGNPVLVATAVEDGD